MSTENKFHNDLSKEGLSEALGLSEERKDELQEKLTKTTQNETSISTILERINEFCHTQEEKLLAAFWLGSAMGQRKAMQESLMQMLGGGE